MFSIRLKEGNVGKVASCCEYNKNNTGIQFLQQLTQREKKLAKDFILQINSVHALYTF